MFVKILRSLRAQLIRRIRPKNGYWLATKSPIPLSRKFGFDRGTPIDRFWIEKFLAENKNYIRGVCLEIGDNNYTKKYGARKVTKSDILDVQRSNKKATIYGNLKNLKGIVSDNTYDSIILTHVLGLIDNYEAAVKECKRITKPGGAILFTSACFSPTYDISTNFWRFTPASAKYIFGKFFDKNKLFVNSYGNVLTGQCFWVGMAQDELTQKELEFNDPKFPCIVVLRAIKSKEGN